MPAKLNEPKDPFSYDADKAKSEIAIPMKDITVLPIMNNIEAECRAHELAGTIQPIDIPPLLDKTTNTFIRPRSRNPSFEECEILGGLVAMGMPLESACSLLTPPLRYEKVAQCLYSNFRRKSIYRRAQSKWLYNALQLLLTRPSKEIMGLIFILRNRHGRLFDGGRIKIDVTSAGSPLQLTSPEVIQRAKEYAKLMQNKTQVIDVETIPQLPVTASVETKGIKDDITETKTYYEIKAERDAGRAREYFRELKHTPIDENGDLIIDE